MRDKAAFMSAEIRNSFSAHRALVIVQDKINWSQTEYLQVHNKALSLSLSLPLPPPPLTSFTGHGKQRSFNEVPKVFRVPGRAISYRMQ